MAIVVVVFGGRRQQTMEDRLHASPQSNDASAPASCSTDPANLAGPSPLSRIRTVDHRAQRALPPRYHGRQPEQAEAPGGDRPSKGREERRGWRGSNGRPRVCVSCTPAGGERRWRRHLQAAAVTGRGGKWLDLELFYKFVLW
jgi:hypothetical protein